MPTASMLLPTPTLTCPGPPKSHLPGGPSVLGALELLVNQAVPKRHRWPKGPTEERGRKEKPRQGRSRGLAAQTHRFTRPAHTFRAWLSFGSRLPRQSHRVGQPPLQAGAGSAAITLVRDGHSQEPVSQGWQPSQEAALEGGSLCPSESSAPPLPPPQCGKSN